MKLKEWTGHTYLSFLDDYIELAFADIAGLQKTLDVVHIRSSAKSYTNQVKAHKHRMASGMMTTIQSNKEMERLINSILTDLSTV